MARETVLIYCPTCKARVEVRVAGQAKQIFCDATETDKVTGGTRVSVGRCGGCNEILVGVEKLTAFLETGFQEGEETWNEAQRLWPEPPLRISVSIPTAIRTSLMEAERCLSCGAFTASVAMSGRALEAVGKHFHANTSGKPVMLMQGLRELHTNKVIDERLYQWGEELREHRNLAAHATNTNFSERDAEDLLAFALAICEYVFVVPEKYDAFLRRKNSKKPTAGAS